MKNWKLHPHNSNVAEYIDCYWFLERQNKDRILEYPKLNPDPAAHLILASAGQEYQFDYGSEPSKGKGSHWIFPHCKTLVMDHSRSFTILGIKFHVGALYSLNIKPKQPVIDQIIEFDINQITRSKGIQESELLMTAEKDSERCREILDKLLAPWLFDTHQDRHSQLVKRAYPLLSDIPVSQMGEALQCSQRTIERSFLRVTGLTLKQCQSMDRLEAMLQHLQNLEEKDIDWADVANLFGFSDQSHLIRYLKTNIGKTPVKYVQQRDLAIDIYGDFEES